jgi:hypothetical protein
METLPWVKEEGIEQLQANEEVRTKKCCDPVIRWFYPSRLLLIGYHSFNFYISHLTLSLGAKLRANSY